MTCPLILYKSLAYGLLIIATTAWTEPALAQRVVLIDGDVLNPANLREGDPVGGQTIEVGRGGLVVVADRKEFPGADCELWLFISNGARRVIPANFFDVIRDDCQRRGQRDDSRERDMARRRETFSAELYLFVPKAIPKLLPGSPPPPPRDAEFRQKIDALRANVNRQQLPPAPGRAVDLTGVWRCNDGGTYFVRQIGNEIWWYGQSGDGGAMWTNVFHGRIDGFSINGNWADVPRGQSTSNGVANLRLLNGNSFQMVTATGGFGGTQWDRSR